MENRGQVYFRMENRGHMENRGQVYFRTIWFYLCYI